VLVDWKSGSLRSSSRSFLSTLPTIRKNHLACGLLRHCSLSPESCCRTHTRDCSILLILEGKEEDHGAEQSPSTRLCVLRSVRLGKLILVGRTGSCGNHLRPELAQLSGSFGQTNIERALTDDRCAPHC
jgi:hypothetical protein